MSEIAPSSRQLKVNDKIAGEDLRLAFSMLDMVIGRPATDLIIKEMQRRGVRLNDANKSYSIVEIQKALGVTFSQDSVTALVGFLKRRLSISL